MPFLLLRLWQYMTAATVAPLGSTQEPDASARMFTVIVSACPGTPSPSTPLPPHRKRGTDGAAADVAAGDAPVPAEDTASSKRQRHHKQQQQEEGADEVQEPRRRQRRQRPRRRGAAPTPDAAAASSWPA
jgi:hypothetical protein